VRPAFKLALFLCFQTDPPIGVQKNEERALSLDELVAKVTKEIENTGLVGKALYRCGHTGKFQIHDISSNIRRAINLQY